MLNIDRCARRLSDGGTRKHHLLGRSGNPAAGGELQTEQSRWFDPTVGRWLSEDPSGLAPDADAYRYCGNAPTDGADPSGLAANNAASLFPSSRTWTSSGGGSRVVAQLTSISKDGLTVILKPKNGEPIKVSVSKLSTADQEFVAGLVAIPANIVIDPCIKNEEVAGNKDKEVASRFREQVIRDFAKLSKTTEGAKVLKQLASVAQPTTTRLLGGKPAQLDPFNTAPATIVPSSGDNTTTYELPTGPNQPATNVVVHYNPNKTTGDAVVGGGSKERPALVGLDKELYSAYRALMGTVGTQMQEERKSRKCAENPLRVELGYPEAQMP